MKRVLVTGAHGFIGRHCLPLLEARGYEVHAISRQVRDEPGPARWHTADLLSDGAEAILSMLRPSHLLHLAWTAEPGKYWKDPDNDRWTKRSLALVQAFARLGGSRAVVAGTCAEYDWAGPCCVEDQTPLAPASPYGIAKHLLHASLIDYAGKTGLSVGWGRVFWLYGPHENPLRLVPSAVLAMMAGRSYECRNPALIRDFLHVEDVAAGFVSLLDDDRGDAVNIASGEGVALGTIVYEIAALLGRPELAVVAGRSPGEEPPVLVGSSARLWQLGWHPKHDLRTGLRQTVRWWTENTR